MPGRTPRNNAMKVPCSESNTPEIRCSETKLESNTIENIEPVAEPKVESMTESITTLKGKGTRSVTGNNADTTELSRSPASSPPLADFKVGVDNVIFSVDLAQNRLLVLLVLRDVAPFQDQWSLPGTLVRQGESLEQGAYRVLAEKIRANNLYLEQLYSFGGPQRDPREAQTSFGVRYLSVSYFALVGYEAAELIADGVSGIAWYPLEQVPELAFDHNQILQYGYRRLRNKLEYSPIAFDVLPELFTLNELYQLYTTVLGEHFADYSNFRTKLLKLGFLSDTGVKVSRGAGRPASLYRFDAEAFAPLKDKPLVFI